MSQLRAIVVFALLVITIYAGLTFLQSHNAYAQTTQTTGLQTNGLGSCSNLPEAKGGLLLGRIMPCLIYSIIHTASDFEAKMIWLLEPLFWAFLVFVVTMFGVRVLQGEREIGVQAFVLTLKVTIAVGILAMIPYQINYGLFGVIDSGVQITLDALEPTTFGELCNKDVAKYGDINTPRVWMQLDCILGKLFGFAIGTEPNPDGSPKVNMLLHMSVVGLATGFFFGGTLGVAVFFAMIGTLWSIVMVVVRITFAYVNGYLIVCVGLIIAPLFLPLMFLRITTDYFERWWKMILGGIMLPIIVTAYSVLGFIMYDRLLFRQDSILQNLFSSTNVENALQHSSAPCDFNITSDPSFKGTPGTDDLATIIKNPFVQVFANPLLSGGSNLCGLISTPSFKISDVLGKDFQQGSAAFKKIFIEAFKLFVMAFLIGEGLKTVEGLVSMLANSRAAASASSVKTEAETNISTAMSNYQQKLGDALSDTSKPGAGATGSDFVKKFTDLIGRR